MATTSFVQNGLVRIAYEVAGEGPPIVLLHGLLGDRVTVRPLADALVDTHMVVSLDLRGHAGSSAIHGIELSVAELAHDVISVMDTLGVAQAIVVGVDLGAVLASALGDRASHVIAINPPGSMIADEAVLEDVAESAYKGLGEKAISGWLNIAWGPDWQDRVPRPRIAAARRSVASLHTCLRAMMNCQDSREYDVVFGLPGGTPFANDADVASVVAAISRVSAAA